MLRDVVCAGARRLLITGLVLSLALWTVPARASQTAVASAAVPLQAAPLASAALTLPDCIRKAIANRPLLKARLENIEARRALMQQARSARFLPQFNLRTLFGPIPDLPEGFGPKNNFPDYSIDWEKWNVFVRVEMEAFQPLYTFGKLSAAIDAAAAGVEEAEWQQEEEENEIIYRVKHAYHALTLANTMRAFLDDVSDLLRKAEKKIDELIAENNPEVSEIDKLKVRVYRATLEKRKVEAEEGVEVARRALAFLIGDDDLKGVSTIAVKLSKPERKNGLTEEEAVREALLRRPDLARLAQFVKVREAQVTIAKSDRFPTFFLAGRFTFGEAPGRAEATNPYLVDDFNTISGGVALGLQQNLSFHLIEPKVEAARHEWKQAQLLQQDAQQAVKLDVQKTFLDREKAWNTIGFAREAYRNARSWIAAATLNFGMGVISTKDLLEAFVTYSEMEASYDETLYNYLVSDARLARVINSRNGWGRAQ